MHVGDISRRYGGFFYKASNPSDPEPDHEQHRKGIEADIRYVRKNNAEGSLNLMTEIAAYDSVKTHWLIHQFQDLPDIYKIIVDPLCGLPEDGVILHDTGDTPAQRVHKDHFHVWIVDPDGEGN